MKGVFLKDLLQIRGSLPILVPIIVLVCGLLIWFNADIGIMAFFPVFLAMQATSTIFADRTCGWYSYSTTFPVTRSRLVKSKYQLTAAFGLAGIVIGFLVWLTVCACRGNLPDFSQEESWINLELGTILAFATTGILIPLSYLLSRSQEFIATFVAFILPAVMIVWWQSSITSDVTMQDGQIIGNTVNLQMPMLMGFAVFSVLLFVISSFVMPAFIARRDQR